MFRRVLAEKLDKNVFRAATGVSQEDITFIAAALGVVDLGDAGLEFASRHDVRALPQDEWPLDLTLLASELLAIKTMSRDDHEIVDAGASGDVVADGDEWVRIAAVEGLGTALCQREDLVPATAPVPDSVSKTARGAPRVDAPAVDDRPGQAIAENTPGYIAQAFPKLFPFGTGDFHDARAGLEGRPDFGAWGRYVMQWHDGRFIRHPRFRYWFLDTWLRMKTPGVRNVYLRIHKETQDLTLNDLVTKESRRKLVQQMSTVSSNIPGGIGERRRMRQELEAMVDQKEAETADLDENDGAGRLPAGFCTLTCPVYKWDQLHSTILKSYPKQEQGQFRTWEEEEDPTAREVKKKECFYKLAVGNPGVVSWYCALKLEMSVALTRAILSRQLQGVRVPGKEGRTEAMRELQVELQQEMQVDIEVGALPDYLDDWGRVDDSWASFEWSGGGIVHVHIALWISGAPRIDRVIVPPMEGDNTKDVDLEDLDLDTEGEVILEQGEAANRLAAFFDRVYTEYNICKEDVCSEVESKEAMRPGRRAVLGKAHERKYASPEMISEAAFLQCLLGQQAPAPGSAGGDEEKLWVEFDAIISGHEAEERADPMAASWKEATRQGHPLDDKAKACRARRVFVATLAEWMQMHDFHTPFANGPPSKGQSCAKVDNEHSAQETVTCGKLFPRKLILPGNEEVSEDPRRRELYRLWLARNCHFINNFVPIISLATLANMDFQATTTKFGVIEYMTKYMTKAGQGSLLHVMEHSFSLCMEKAREHEQGAGAAILKWFNLQSITDVKSQLEAMHLSFQLPRYLATREFRRLAVRSEVKRLVSSAAVATASSLDGPLLTRSAVDVYLSRTDFEEPSTAHLHEPHPSTGLPLWQFVLTYACQSTEHARLDDDASAEVSCQWPLFLERLSWWEYVRLFKKADQSIRFKPFADVVVVSPFPRLAKPKTDSEWFSSARNALLAYCNHGPRSKTFASVVELDAMEDECVGSLLDRFVNTPKEQRLELGFCSCPPFLRRAWLLGKARAKREDARKRPRDTVLSSLTSASCPRFVFEEDQSSRWMDVCFHAMSEEQQNAAKADWREALDKEENLDPPAPGSGGQPTDEDVDAREIRDRMRQFMRKDLHWEEKDLHDAVVLAGMAAPHTPSVLEYYKSLRQLYGASANAFLPQNAKTHTKARVIDVLRVLSRGGARLGGLAGSKTVLAQRLATVLSWVIDAGRCVQRPKAHNDESGDAEGQSDCNESEEPCLPPPRKRYLVPVARSYGDMPQDAVVDAAQAESALGHNLATELDADDLETPDKDLRAEEEALLARQVNPANVDYSCLCAPFHCVSQAMDTYGWHPPLIPREVTASDFHVERDEMQTKLSDALSQQKDAFTTAALAASAGTELVATLATLDPTQKQVVTVLQDWARDRKQWRDAGHWDKPPPHLKLLLLGTAGTGKTHTAKASMLAVRRILGDFDAVLSVAHTGVAAANLGGGAATIDSVFRLVGDGHEEDLMGDSLDALVETLGRCELLLIDEISTVGAAQFEMICRRLEQVGKALWRKRSGTRPPEDLGGFGGIAVVCMGDFAQLPPVLATSLLPHAQVQEARASGLRGRAIQGRLLFQSFAQVIRLRRIHRQKGADPYKESTIRLRDAAITEEDYKLWQEHILPSADAQPTWDGAGLLQEQGLVLVAENEMAGRVNGLRLRQRAPAIEEPAPGSSLNVVVKCNAVHNDPRGRRRPAEQYRQIRQATHLCVGAAVMLMVNRLWDQSTVPFGLMNGARGVVVAILYGNTNQARVDGLDLAGLGYPDGRRNCPLPQLVIVHFPDYTGPQLLHGLPVTWVPVPCVEVRNKQTKKYVRIGLPLRLAFALTIHKAQGLSLPEGAIVDLQTASPNRNVVAIQGLAFVAWTRVTTWAKMAFRSLPRFGDFLAMRQSKEFKQRAEFERWADKAHDEFMSARGFDAKTEVRLHGEHMQTSLGRDLTEEERGDLNAMLGLRGVASLPDSVCEAARQRLGRSDQVGLSQVVESFRGKRNVLGGEGVNKREGKRRRSLATQKCTRPCQCTDICHALLREHGYLETDITAALNVFGADLEKAADY